MKRIIGQEIALKTLKNILSNGKMPQALFFVGTDSVGKLTTALELSRNILSTPQSSLSLEGVLDSNRFVSIRIDDRLRTMEFLLMLLKDRRTTHSQEVGKHLAFEMKELLSRHERNFIPLLKEKKTSFPEGIKLSEAQLEDLIASCKGLLRKVTNGDFEDIDKTTFLGLFSQLQNSLDRSFIGTETLKKLLETLRMSSQLPRVVVIGDIEKISGTPQVGIFLKLLEEPPENTTLILTTSVGADNPNEVIRPLMSRCFVVRFRELGKRDVKSILEKNYFFHEPIQEQTRGVESAFSEFLSDMRKRLDKETFRGMMWGSESFFYDKIKEFNVKDARFFDTIIECTQLEDNVSLDSKYRALAVLNEIKRGLGCYLSSDSCLLWLCKVRYYFSRGRGEVL